VRIFRPTTVEEDSKCLDEDVPRMHPMGSLRPDVL
jgi:hypothetical protein